MLTRRMDVNVMRFILSSWEVGQMPAKPIPVKIERCPCFSLYFGEGKAMPTHPQWNGGMWSTLRYPTHVQEPWKLQVDHKVKFRERLERGECGSALEYLPDMLKALSSTCSNTHTGTPACTYVCTHQRDRQRQKETETKGQVDILNFYLNL